MERAAIFALVLVRSHLLETRTNECAKNGCIVSLVLINGVPGAGKSRLAEEVAVRRAHTTVVEIDSLRMLLHGWQTRPETMVAARDQAVELIGERLGR